MGKEKNNLTIGQIVFLFIYPLMYPALILWLAGDWFWVEGWIWGGTMVVVVYGMCIYLFIKDPALLKERFQKPGSKNQKSWDKVLLIIFIVAFLVWLVIMPLDAKRFGWSPEFPLWLKVIGGIATAVSWVLIFEVYRENTFLSPLVRIQTERKHKVISTGLYGIVRHPMYAGFIPWIFGASLLLGSLYGLLIAFLLVGLFAVRAVKEEEMLKEELEGYEKYAQKVKYRFIPKVW